MLDLLAPRSVRRRTREEAEAAVRCLIEWAGDDPDREGLLGTPDRVVRSYEEFFAGYAEDPKAMLATTFEETDSYDEMVLLRDIRLESHCEHHMVPIIGKAHVAYLPAGRVVGLGRLPKVVEVLASRPQLQENLTAQIADAIESGTGSRGVVVVIEARHHCVVSRGARQPEANTITMAARGEYAEPVARAEVMALISK